MARHPALAQRTAASGFGHFDHFERPLKGNHAAPPQLAQKLGRRAEVNFAASATGRRVRVAVIADLSISVCSHAKRSFAAESSVFPVQTAAQRRLAVI
jgi:hypothetical protein